MYFLSTEKVCFNENLLTYNGKTLDAESTARRCFVKKKILYFRFLAKPFILEDYFPRGGPWNACKI